MNRQKLFPKYANLTKPDTTATDEDIDAAHENFRALMFRIATGKITTEEEKQTIILAEAAIAQHKLLGDIWKWMKHRR